MRKPRPLEATEIGRRAALPSIVAAGCHGCVRVKLHARHLVCATRGARPVPTLARSGAAVRRCGPKIGAPSC
eukprot:3152940-Prymnesium_polylepis.1